MSSTSGRMFVGLDWATQEHEVCVEDEDGRVIAELQVRHSAPNLAELCRRLNELSGGDRERVRVALRDPWMAFARGAGVAGS